MIGGLLVMRYGPRAGWKGRYVSIAGRYRDLAHALDHATRANRLSGPRFGYFIARAGAPATVPRADRSA